MNAPAARVAAPAYLGADFSQAAPGHRFGLYYAGWAADFSVPKDGKVEALRNLSKFPTHSSRLLAALLLRQEQLAAGCEGDLLSLPLRASSPLATGLGNEHPLENGFAFLAPYGLPYLPGSSIKGVVRRAAEELASGSWGESSGWSAAAIRNLFGPGEEDASRDSEPRQGALLFWDAFPKTPQDRLGVEIMTPHLGKYYSGEATPNSSLLPTPIPFLVVPAGADFAFYVASKPGLLDPQLKASWRELLTAAFRHAGEWLGFGAKTAVGYGRLHFDEDAQARRQKAAAEAAHKAEQAAAEAAHAARLAEMSPLERSIQEVIDARPQGQSETKALYNAFRQGRWQGDAARAVAERLQKQMQGEKLWFEKSNKKKPEKDEPYQMTLAVLQALKA